MHRLAPVFVFALALLAGPASSQVVPPDALCCQLASSTSSGYKSQSCFALDPENEIAVAFCAILGSPGVGPCNPKTGSCIASLPACCELESSNGSSSCFQTTSCAVFGGNEGVGPCENGRCLATF